MGASPSTTPLFGYWLFLPQITCVFLFNLAINEQGHIFPVAASPGMFLAGFDVGPVGRKGGGLALAVLDRADVANDYFALWHD